MSNDWRDGLECFPTYKRKFAWKAVVLADGEKIWLKPYYRKYLTWHTNHKVMNFDEDYHHTDMVEAISEETYVIRRLSENF